MFEKLLLATALTLVAGAALAANGPGYAPKGGEYIWATLTCITTKGTEDCAFKRLISEHAPDMETLCIHQARATAQELEDRFGHDTMARVFCMYAPVDRITEWHTSGPVHATSAWGAAYPGEQPPMPAHLSITPDQLAK
jgi:hypothetical protein